MRLAIIGLGYWGPNLLRAAADLEDVEVVALCDSSPGALARQARRHPYVRVTESLDDILLDDTIDAVIVATPVQTHYEIARSALQAGKHTFVEKPVATTSDDCRDLISLAVERDLVLMPGHVFLYSPAVVAIKKLLDEGALGEIYFVTSTRVNLGIHRSDSSVIQDLAPHDFSILHYWFGVPTFARTIARDSVVPGLWDVAFIDLGFGRLGPLARVELSWLAPTKLRRTVIAGSKAMIVYDDTATEQVRIFDRGAIFEPHTFGTHRAGMAYRVGDVVSPHIDAAEPLRLELADFVASIQGGGPPRSNMYMGLEIVQIVEACELSLRHNGAPVQVALSEGERRRVPDRRSVLAARRFDPDAQQGGAEAAVRRFDPHAPQDAVDAVDAVEAADAADALDPA